MVEYIPCTSLPEDKCENSYEAKKSGTMHTFSIEPWLMDGYKQKCADMVLRNMRGIAGPIMPGIFINVNAPSVGATNIIQSAADLMGVRMAVGAQGLQRLGALVSDRGRAHTEYDRLDVVGRQRGLRWHSELSGPREWVHSDRVVRARLRRVCAR